MQLKRQQSSCSPQDSTQHWGRSGKENQEHRKRGSYDRTHLRRENRLTSTVIQPLKKRKPERKAAALAPALASERREADSCLRCELAGQGIGPASI